METDRKLAFPKVYVTIFAMHSRDHTQMDHTQSTPKPVPAANPTHDRAETPFVPALLPGASDEINDGSQGAEHQLQPVVPRWIHVMQVVALCNRQLRRALADATSLCHLSDTEFFLLWACHEGPQHGVGQHDMASVLGVSGAQMSGMVYDLRDRGLLLLDRPAWDRRRQLLRITSSGRSLLDQTLSNLAPLARELERALPDNELAMLLALISQMTTGASTRPAPDEPIKLPIKPCDAGQITGEITGEIGLRRAS
ncbi:MAG: HTH-type transcriptional repressor NicR [Planctomycetota bacterium]